MQYFSCPAKSTGFFEQSGHTENSPQCSHSLQPDPPLQVFWHLLQRFTLSRSSRLLALCSCLASRSFLASTSALSARGEHRGLTTRLRCTSTPCRQQLGRVPFLRRAGVIE